MHDDVPQAIEYGSVTDVRYDIVRGTLEFSLQDVMLVDGSFIDVLAKFGGVVACQITSDYPSWFNRENATDDFYSVPVGESVAAELFIAPTWFSFHNAAGSNGPVVSTVGVEDFRGFRLLASSFHIAFIACESSYTITPSTPDGS
jgi:hypothetical protein